MKSEIDIKSPAQIGVEENASLSEPSEDMGGNTHGTKQ